MEAAGFETFLHHCVEKSSKLAHGIFELCHHSVRLPSQYFAGGTGVSLSCGLKEMFIL